VADISPVDALEAKLLVNEQKYPIDKSKASSAKYDRLYGVEVGQLVLRPSADAYARAYFEGTISRPVELVCVSTKIHLDTYQQAWLTGTVVGLTCVLFVHAGE
jgi:hypothetical protein